MGDGRALARCHAGGKGIFLLIVESACVIWTHRVSESVSSSGCDGARALISGLISRYRALADRVSLLREESASGESMRQLRGTRPVSRLSFSRIFSTRGIDQSHKSDGNFNSRARGGIRVPRMRIQGSRRCV